MEPIKIDYEKYPSNSFADKGKKERTKMKQVADVKDVKKSFGKRLVSLLIPEDISDIKRYIIEDVIIPEIKEIIMSSVETALTGSSRRRNSGGKTDYTKKYVSPQPKATQQNTDSRTVFRSDDYVFQTRDEAEDVLANLVGAIEEFDSVSVSDFLDSIGKVSVYTDENYGWESLGAAKIKRVREGYILELPRPISLVKGGR